MSLRSRIKEYQFLWWWREVKIRVPDFHFGHGYWPDKSYGFRIFEYWHIGPLEIRRLFEKPVKIKR